jgi:hypothetical protein
MQCTMETNEKYCRPTGTLFFKRETYFHGQMDGEWSKKISKYDNSEAQLFVQSVISAAGCGTLCPEGRHRQRFRIRAQLVKHRVVRDRSHGILLACRCCRGGQVVAHLPNSN